ncbi:Assimilatory nitrate reductase catalytic subunit [Zhongshania aliphaticivorans]|uniref:Assimilatory nitrate reductase catalytic subunit n=1 Tax=Zhongshania aliphaticivorans TaxID=1470434 RepID=A0A5S9MPY6_9GAMM|nr:molybdopterin oxidoreductase family protein [Zhongshania aliphaticivorans]CAA0078946.1 Assimilatory nitrate reductase catalytic subunit [Zhongshania aliphaticivorans]CAA0086357.1 Assimilatory nitrate reductase catalytic subunit [Zhongshania aliphaticivorans]
MTEAKKHYRTCNLCEAMCGIEITVENEKISSIKGDAEDSFSRGHICPKAIALKDLYEDPDRIRKPMEKVDGEWRELSWDEAFDKVVARIQSLQAKHGNDALGVYLGNPNVHNTGSLLMSGSVLRALNTKNKFSATSVDQLPHHIVSWKLFGHQLRIPVPDIDNTDHFLIFGANPLASNGSIMSVADVKQRLKDVRKRGKVVVVDPRRTATAELADAHHFVRPGTDVLVLLAMLHVLFAEGLVNTGNVAKHFDQGPMSLADKFTEYSPEKVAPITGMSAAIIRDMVRDFCSAKAPVLYGRLGVSVQEFGTLSQYLIMLFNMLTGRLDSVGGLMFTKPAVDILAQSGRGNMGRFHSRVRGLPEFNGELPVAALAEEITTPGEGQIKGMILIAGNPVLSTPNGEQLDRAFKDLELQVAIDFYINESSRHADFILPPVSPLEREHYDVIFNVLAVRDNARYAKALFPRKADARHDWEILLSLRDRLQPPKGLKEKLSRQLLRSAGPAGLLTFLLRQGPYGGGLNPFKGLSLGKLKRSPHGVDLGALKPALPKGLYHRDRKIHLEAEFFLKDLARVDSKFFDNDGVPEKFLLIGRRDVRSNNSWLHNSHRLVKGKSRCTALINPLDAQALAIADGDMVKVSSRVGSVELAAQLSDEMMTGVISIPHGWGHSLSGTQWQTAEAHAGVSVNDLTDEMHIDELSGNAVLNGVPVTLESMSMNEAVSA